MIPQDSFIRSFPISVSNLEKMYKIIKIIHCDTKPTWMVCLLYKIPPTVYDWQDSTDACKKRLIIIKNIIEKTSVRWHRGNKSLTQIRDVKMKDGSLVLSTKSGRSSLSFSIVQKSAN